jgi:hypothetical protein
LQFTFLSIECQASCQEASCYQGQIYDPEEGHYDEESDQYQKAIEGKSLDYFYEAKASNYFYEAKASNYSEKVYLYCKEIKGHKQRKDHRHYGRQEASSQETKQREETFGQESVYCVPALLCLYI